MVPRVAVGKANFGPGRYHGHCWDELHLFLVDQRLHRWRIFGDTFGCGNHNNDCVWRGFAVFVNNAHLQAARMGTYSAQKRERKSKFKFFHSHFTVMMSRCIGAKRANNLF